MKSTLMLATLATALGLMTVAPSFAADEVNVSSGVTTTGQRLGLHGVDAVALSTLNAVAEGSADFPVVHDGVAYYFSSKESARTFEMNPEGYLPQYGGFCAYAIALGKKFDGDPVYGDIVDGKLYLFVNAQIFAEYKKDSKRILANAEKKWPQIQHKAVEDL
jgi:YHS domain-containing protein